MSRLATLHRMLAAPGADADAELLYMIAQEHAKTGAADDAIAWFDRAIAANPGFAYAYFHKAKVQADAGDTAAAITTLRAGAAVAKAQRDAKAASEIGSFLDEIEG